MKKSNDVFNEYTTSDCMTITKRMVYLRENILHMTQSEFATMLNISQTYLSLLENGKKAINESTLKKLLLTFKLNLQWLTDLSVNDDCIFTSGGITREFLTQSSLKSSLDSLQKNCHLGPEEVRFFQWLLSLPREQRSAYISSFHSLACLLKAYPPDMS